MRRRAGPTVVVAIVTASVAFSGLSLVGVAPSARAAEVAAPQAQGSVEQVAVTGAKPGASARLVNAGGRAVATKAVDRQGAALFRHVAPGVGYVVKLGSTRSKPVAVTNPDDAPDASTYSSQHLGPGFGYIKTRDGTLLSANVTLPGPVEDGPYPTVVEYSGYDPSNPGGRQPASAIASLLGYATVGVNVRGTGCSGGAFDYFEALQSLDGYDAIEAVAAQPWVANGKVGMVGISYAGITQLFVAATRPPHLAAITPLSVIDDTYWTLYPGGILNNGFAVQWGEDRQHDARPAANEWVRERIAGGDSTCKANQTLRLQSPSIHREIAEFGPDRVPADDAVDPSTFVDRIDVPVFIAGAWQDEETGGHFPELLDKFAPGVVKATLMNGEHADSLGPEVLTRWAEFLDFYVARRIPHVSPAVRAIAGVVLARVFGDGVALPPDRFDGQTDFGTALASYEAEPPVRVLFDSGAGGASGALAGFETTLSSWPPAATSATTWYFQPGGGLSDAKPTGTASDPYTYDPSAFARTSKGGWKPLPNGKATAYLSEPLAADTVMLGPGSVDLWLRSTAPDVDVEVTVSEVRPDGRETYVQSGWLRASRRVLDTAASTALDPVPTFLERDAAALPKNRFSLVRVPLFPFGHAFRAGSRVRIAVQPPGGNRPSWAFASLAYPKKVTNDIAVSHDHASRAVLPVISGVDVPTPLPACGSLRGQPCREYVPTANASKGPP